MPLTKTHRVLCPACRKGAVTLYAYEDSRCGYTALVDRPDGGLVRVSCTEPPGHCRAHYDRHERVKFTEGRALRGGTEGQTRRA